jgi:hypothetical protein
MMHPGDVEQELLDTPGLRIVKVVLHLDAPLPHRIVYLIGRENGNLKECPGALRPRNLGGAMTFGSGILQRYGEAMIRRDGDTRINKIVFLLTCGVQGTGSQPGYIWPPIPREERRCA